MEAHWHIWSDDRLQESDKSKVSDSKNKISVAFLRPLWQGKYWCAAALLFVFHRLKITSLLTNFPMDSPHFSPQLRKNDRDGVMPVVENWLGRMESYCQYNIVTTVQWFMKNKYISVEAFFQMTIGFDSSPVLEVLLYVSFCFVCMQLQNGRWNESNVTVYKIERNQM